MPASRAHFAAISAIEQAAVAIFPPSDLPSEIRYLVTDHDDLQSAVEADHIWTAVTDDGEPVGFALMSVLDGSAHLYEMDVHPDHGRNGIGTELVHTVERQARAEDYSQLTLVTFRHLLWNAPFYSRLGFEPVTAEDVGEEALQLLAEEEELGINRNNRLIMKKCL